MQEIITKLCRISYKSETKTLKHDSLASFARDVEGTLQSVQLTKLNENSARATLQGNKLPKIHYGHPKGTFVTIQFEPQSSRVFLAEGLETALSIKMAGREGDYHQRRRHP
jgi:phage/plasmid primase-like uncharacterized protein